MTLEVISAGVGWVWEGDYMSITWHCTSGEESIVTATVPVNLLPSQGSLVPSQGSLVLRMCTEKQTDNLRQFKLCTDVMSRQL